MITEKKTPPMNSIIQILLQMKFMYYAKAQRK